jgi:hypothetical protein
MPVGNITRGTTNPNRLRRVDRWISAHPVLRRTDDPLVVDLGYGASAVTTVELRERLLRVRPDVEVVGFEIDPARVDSARADLVRWGMVDALPPISFELGGFETPLPRGRTAAVIRAFNVLRQYDEADVPAAWSAMLAAVQRNGLLVDGTCDEIGRVSTWIALTPGESGTSGGSGASGGPKSLTISLRLDGLEHPSIAAERLPKALIHHNVAGDPVNKLMTDLDRWWAVHAGLGAFGASQRWMATVESLKTSGWPVLAGRTRWRLGEVTIAWDALGRA